MLFSNQKIFLDTKDYNKVDRLEADICRLGGVIEKFLSKEITCVVTNRAKTETLSLKKDVAGTLSTQAPPSQASVCGSRVLSRGQSLLMRSNSLKDTSVCDPVAFAQMWDIRIVGLDTVIRAIDRQLQTLDPSSTSAKHFTKPHYHTKRRKFPDTLAQGTERNSRPRVTKFSGAFVKFEDTESNFRPFFKQYLTFPRFDINGDLSNGLFKCAELVRPAAPKKSISTLTGTKKQKAWNKRGYCECCDTMYDDLSQHLSGEDHRHFAEHAENFASLDKLIDMISSCGVNSLSLPTEEDCTHCVDTEKAFNENTNEMHVSNDNDLCTAELEPFCCHRSLLTENHSTDQHGEHQISDIAVQNGEGNAKVSGEQTKYSVRCPMHITVSDTESYSMESEEHLAHDVPENHSADRHGELQMSDNAVQNGEGNINISEEQTNHSVRSPIHVTVSNTISYSVESEHRLADDIVDKNRERLESSALQGFSVTGNPLPSSAVVTQSVSSHTTVASCKEKSYDMFVGGTGSPNHSDDMPEYISSEYVVNLLEVLSSENSVHSPLFAEETGSVSLEACENRTTVTSVELPCVPAPSSNHTVNCEILPTEPEHCRETDMGSRECLFPLTGTQNDLSDDPSTAITLESHDTNADRSRTGCKHESDIVTLSSCSNVPSPSELEALAVDKVLLIPSDEMDESDSRSFSINADGSDASVLAPREAHFPPMSLDQPSTCPTTATSETQIYGAFLMDDLAFLPVQSDLNANNFDLHDQLLTMAYWCTPDIVEHNQQPSCSSAQASTDDTDASAHNNNDNNIVTTINDDLCLQLALDPPLCFSESSGQPVESDDDGLSTPVHSRSDSCENLSIYNGTSARCMPFCRNDSFDNPSTYNGTSARCMPFCRNDSSENLSTYNDTSARCMPFCRSPPLSGLGSLVALNRTDVCLESTMPNTGLQGSVEMNAVSYEQQYMQHVQEKGDSHVAQTSDTEITSGVTEKCILVHGPEKCYKANSVDSVQLEVRLANDNIFHSMKSSVDGFGSTVNTCSTSLLQPAVNKSSNVRPDSFDKTELAEESDTDDNSGSTMIYECDLPTSSRLECASDKCCTDKNESETTLDCMEFPPVSSAKSTWRVISCVDCRMRLVRRTEVDFSVLSTQNDAEINCKSSVLGPETHNTSTLVDKMDALSDGMSAMVISDECGNLPLRQPANNENEIETTVDQREPANSTWEVLSTVGCRMRLTRNKADFPARTVPSNSRQWCANSSCDLESNQFLSNVADSVLTC